MKPGTYMPSRNKAPDDQHRCAFPFDQPADDTTQWRCPHWLCGITWVWVEEVRAGAVITRPLLSTPTIDLAKSEWYFRIAGRNPQSDTEQAHRLVIDALDEARAIASNLLAMVDGYPIFVEDLRARLDAITPTPDAPTEGTDRG